MICWSWRQRQMLEDKSRVNFTHYQMIKLWIYVDLEGEIRADLITKHSLKVK